MVNSPESEGTLSSDSDELDFPTLFGPGVDDDFVSGVTLDLGALDHKTLLDIPKGESIFIRYSDGDQVLALLGEA